MIELKNNTSNKSCWASSKSKSGQTSCETNNLIENDNLSIQLTKEICSANISTNPLEIFEKIIESPNIPMLGCHHAFMAAGALITAKNNDRCCFWNCQNHSRVDWSELLQSIRSEIY